MAASPFLVLWMLDSVVASGFENNRSEEVPLHLPDWLFADSTALIAGTVAAVGILASIICFLIRGRMQHLKSVAVDEALLREMRGESNDT